MDPNDNSSDQQKPPSSPTTSSKEPSRKLSGRRGKGISGVLMLDTHQAATTNEDTLQVPSSPGNASVAMEGSGTEFKPRYIRTGYLMKTGTITGFYSRRYVELHGGKVTWSKSATYKPNDEMSQRHISGACIVPLRNDVKLVKKHKSLFVFVVYLTFDPRTTHLKPLVFAAESEHDMNEWVAAFRSASGWQYYPLALQPYPRRLTGLVVVEIICIENVIGVDWGKTSDTYVVVEYNRMRARTCTIYETTSAQFNHIVSIPVYLDDPNLTLNIQVFDEESIGEDSPLGGVSLPLHSLGFHQEKVWNKVSLKSVFGLKIPPNSTSDPFGTVSFRTYYSSSKITQFLPLTGRPAIMKFVGGTTTSPPLSPRPVSPPPKAPVSPTSNSSGPLENDEEVDIELPVIEDPTSENEGDQIDEAVKAAMDPTAATASSLRLKKSAAAAAANEVFVTNPFDYDFSLDMMKLQLARVVAIFGLLKSFKTISYFLNWRDPKWTMFIYAWISWISFIEPGSGLIFVFVMMGKKLLEAHPSYTDFRQELVLLRDIMAVRLSFVADTIQYIRTMFWKNARDRMARRFSVRRKTVEDLVEEHSSFCQSSMVTRALSDEGIAYRVFECQRRTMPKAGQVLSAMVAAPAAATVSAMKKMAGDDDDDNEEKLIQIRKMFMAFSGDHLRHATETRWVSPTGTPLLDSPATVMDGIKIKWTVLIDKKSTDENGWEYSRKLPNLFHQSVADIAEAIATNASGLADGAARRFSRRSTVGLGLHHASRCLISSEAVEYDPKSTVWGFNHPFDAKLNLTRHWTRRRVWVGVPIRAAFESEDPVKLNEIVASMEDKAHEADDMVSQMDDSHANRGLMAKYRAILREGKKLQSSIFDVSTKIESIKNLCTWKSRWISSAIFSLVIFLLSLSLLLPQPIVLWLVLSFLLVDHLSDIQRKEKLMRPFLNAVVAEIEESKFSDNWKQDLAVRLNSFYTRLDDVNADYSASIVYGLFSRACRRLGWRNVRLNLQNFTDTSDGANTGGPVTVAMLLEDIYTMYHNKNEDWWKRVKTTVHPKNLIQSHLVSDWEEYNPTSLFSGNQSEN